MAKEEEVCEGSPLVEGREELLRAAMEEVWKVAREEEGGGGEGRGGEVRRVGKSC